MTHYDSRLSYNSSIFIPKHHFGSYLSITELDKLRKYCFANAIKVHFILTHFYAFLRILTHSYAFIRIHTHSNSEGNKTMNFKLPDRYLQIIFPKTRIRTFRKSIIHFWPTNYLSRNNILNQNFFIPNPLFATIFFFFFF
jgi:hypothetical protein